MSDPQNANLSSVLRPQTDPLDPPPADANTNDVVAFNETNVGPLVGMKIAGSSNQFDFDSSQPYPARTAKVVKDSDPQPANSTRVCSGTIGVAGVSTACTAWRPSN